MNDREFVGEFYKLKESLLDEYFAGRKDAAVAQLIEKLELPNEKLKTLKLVIDASLTDALYTVLLGLEGSASIGNEQEMYKLYNEDGVELTGKDIEGHAWDLFHNQ
jgi:hypothetical protein